MPAVQLLQKDIPREGAYIPDGHSEHAEEPEVEVNLPWGHKMQAPLLAEFEYEPDSQGVHDDLPVEPWYVPGKQLEILEEESLIENEPTGAETQSPRPIELE